MRIPETIISKNGVINMKKIFFIGFAVFIASTSFFYWGDSAWAERIFEVDSTWYQPIPQDPVISPDSDKYVNGIIHADNGETRIGIGYGEYSTPIWQADASTPYTTVIIDAPDYVFLNATNHRSEAQTTGGTPFALMANTSDYLYIGDVINKNSVIFKLSTLGSGYTLSVEYSKGSGAWGNVSGLTDNASGFSALACSADCRLSFTQPGDWAVDTVNGIGSRYWLRIKTTSEPTTIAKAYFMAYGDNDGEATLRGWNIVPIPNGAKGAGQDTRSCPYYPQLGSNFDGQLAVLSADGKWIWEFYQARKCDPTTLPAQYQNDSDALSWHANTVRKRARTAAAAAEEPYVWNGSGVASIVDLGGGTYNQYDDKGSLMACSASAVTQGIITRSEYDSGVIPHALSFAYSGEGPTVPHYGYYPCLRNVTGTKNDIDSNTKYMSFGQRIQLNPTYDCIANIPNTNTGYIMSRMICEAFKKYGAIMVDIGGGPAKKIEAESNYGKPTDIWSGLIPSNTLPANVWTHMRIVEPVCPDSRICLNNSDIPSTLDTTPPARPSGLALLSPPASILSNPGFESGTSPWVFYTNGSGTFNVDAAGNGSANAGHVVITTAGTNVQLYQANTIIESNTLYQLSFKAYSNTGDDVWLTLHKHGSPYTNYGLSKSVDLTTSWQEYSIQFTTSGFSNTVYDGRMVFLLSNYNSSGDEYFFDDVVLTKLGAAN